MHRLVCSGYARPGQASWDLLNAFSVDMILDFAYGEVVKDLDAEQRLEVDKALEKAIETALGEDAKTVPVKKSDGTVIYVSPERWNRLMNNRRTSRTLDPRKG